MKCIKCGKDLAEGAKFCLNCGAKVVDLAAIRSEIPAEAPKTEIPEVPNTVIPEEIPNAEIPEAPKAAFCPKCGTPLAPGQKFCLKCGASADGAAKAPRSAGKGINKKWFIIGGCALLAVILAVVLIVVIAGGGVGKNGASSPEAVGKACFNTQLDGDVEGYYGLFCTPILRDQSDMDEDATREDMIKYLAEKNASMSSISEMLKYGVSVDIKDVEAETGYEISSHMFYNFTEEERAKVEDTAKVVVTMEYSMSGFSQTDTQTVYCVKMDGKWFLLDD